MRKSDLVVLVCAILFFLPFFVFDSVYQFYISFNKEHSIISGFIKFAVLATFGELLGLRIKTGHYLQKGFGVFPRALVWGVIGITIVAVFKIFSTGVPAFLASLGVDDISQAMNEGFSLKKLLGSFTISATLNIAYAPIMMTMHKITDTHILNTGGSLRGLFKPLDFVAIISNLNWRVQWDFVFMKTIPFFWIPAHTITFLLPPEFQVLMAAMLGIALGVILAVAAKKN